MTHGTDYAASRSVLQRPPVRPARGWISWLIVLANAVCAAILTGQSLAGAGRATGSTAVIGAVLLDRKSTRLNSSPRQYLVCRLLLEKKKIPYRFISLLI